MLAGEKEGAGSGFFLGRVLLPLLLPLLLLLPLPLDEEPAQGSDGLALPPAPLRFGASPMQAASKASADTAALQHPRDVIRVVVVMRSLYHGVVEASSGLSDLPSISHRSPSIPHVLRRCSQEAFPCESANESA
jgi:hypothetical protein